MKKLIDVTLENSDIDSLISQFHFEVSDREKLEIMYKTVQTLLDGCIYYENATGKISGIDYENYMVALVTLGSGIDDMIELYLSHEKVIEAYMVDCIGLKLLSKGYERLVMAVQDSTGMQVKELCFPGDKYPTSVLADICELLGANEVALTDAHMLRPLKSAGIILPLEKKEGNLDNIKNVCDTCANCNNFNCALRKIKEKTDDNVAYNYGYMRIFGNRS